MEIKSKRLQKSYQRGATRRFCYLCARYFYDSTFFFCYFAARKLNETKINLEDMDLKQFTLLIGVASLPSLATAATVYRTISKVAAVTVDCPEGTAPRLPNLVWVTYSDGYSEYQQV
jgi:hypothetical protein